MDFTSHAYQSPTNVDQYMKISKPEVSGTYSPNCDFPAGAGPAWLGCSIVRGWWGLESRLGFRILLFLNPELRS